MIGPTRDLFKGGAFGRLDLMQRIGTLRVGHHVLSEDELVLSDTIAIMGEDAEEILSLRRAVASMQRDLDDANTTRDAAQTRSSALAEENRVLRERLAWYLP